VHGVNLIPDLAGRLPLLGLNWMDPQWLLQTFGQEMFWISVVIIFIECGLLFPILPGDTLLFFIGIFIGSGDIGIDIVPACVIMSASAFLGNVVGFEIGAKFGAPLFQRDGRWLNERNLEKTHRFFDRYGNRALVLGRFVPIVRTYITAVAGIGDMDRRRFFTWSLVGATLWATGLLLLGYFLGGVTFLQNHLELTLLLIVALSLIPIAVEWWRQRRHVDQTS
jgi:membrane-associated protein